MAGLIARWLSTHFFCAKFLLFMSHLINETPGFLYTSPTSLPFASLSVLFCSPRTCVFCMIGFLQFVMTEVTYDDDPLSFAFMSCVLSEDVYHTLCGRPMTCLVFYFPFSLPYIAFAVFFNGFPGCGNPDGLAWSLFPPCTLGV
ncbi:hypothetical protein BO86DRAFT_18693 [Aspergillus japonicus CBS 114.51]|uniref:Uncharacterized protein n=2 Tax=Aspergillus TaxID=5052 RepID=A0A2V5H1M6_ASPV1|nr:hypothetical protein BO86DRAFT_18693 [Aspergillus japonicus CBS 114.51]PYI15534.1 hypothetical protein BO99DRAFT_249030 [Aspergillus violaceofuscus CBS 115571]RAH76331.1 hypothetical protein BO86DRAFT_18693 [Aspergillus japonicus CBS 114.51]